MIEQFFLVCPVGFEEIAEKELSFWSKRLFFEDANEEAKLAVLQRVKGGIEFSATPAHVFELHYYLKIPTRILMRLKEFRCKDFSKLFNKVQKIAWNSWVGACTINWKVSSKNSRLKMLKRIEETCEEGFAKYRKGNETKKNWPSEDVSVYVRLVDDNLSLSLDLSGEHLHRRGQRKSVLLAPIRENIAAALCWMLLDEVEKNNSANQISLVDPMMGAGTFLLEGAQLLQRIENREFSFEKYPMYFDEPLKNIPEKKIQTGITQLVGRDVLGDSLKAAQQNLKTVNIKYDLDVEDVFKAEKRDHSSRQRIYVITNPPYNQRISLNKKREDYYKVLVRNIFEAWSPEKVGVIVPKGESQQIKKIKDINCLGGYPFSNGGIDVIFFLLERAN